MSYVDYYTLGVDVCGAGVTSDKALPWLQSISSLVSDTMKAGFSFGAQKEAADAARAQAQAVTASAIQAQAQLEAAKHASQSPVAQAVSSMPIWGWGLVGVGTLGIIGVLVRLLFVKR